MFRPIRRKKNEISDELAKDLLLKSKRGIFSVNGDDGYPYSIPVNYFYDEENGRIYFHGAKVGHKVDALKKSDKVCFTVFGNESFKEDDWAPYVQSTVAFGRCHLIEDQTKSIELVRELATKYYPNKDLIEEEIVAYGNAVQMFEIVIEHLSGKMIHEK